MANITVLDQNTINKIAAGEVIERPAAVVKELLENALDAGATAVTVEIKDGGTSFIRVTDNGCGIPKEEIALAFLRHATSKIKSVEDLLTVSSLGFRGEALASIAAVSQVELITKTWDCLTGFRYQIEGGQEKELEEVGAPDGTTFIARNLFFNTPARKQFLKSAAAEGAHVAALVEKIALSHPEVSVRFIQNNQNRLHTSGNGSLKDLIYTVFGREIATNLVAVQNEMVDGFAGKPVIARSNRNYENYFINGRYIKSRLISAAIEEAYKPFMMQHKYPFVLLHFTIDPTLLDVNVHPTKMELRFRDGEIIFTRIKESIARALSQKELIPKVELSAPPKQADTVLGKLAAQTRAEPFETKRREMYQQSLKQISSVPDAFAGAVSEAPAAYGAKTARELTPLKLEQEAGQPENPDRPKPDGIRPAAGNAETAVPVQQQLFDDRFLEKAAREKHRLIGQLFATYWLVEYEKKLFIIDQHAAHEKILFEKTMAMLKNRNFDTQMLLPPIILSLSSTEELLFKNYMTYFNEMGFEIEHFGGKEYAVRGVPANLFSLGKKELLLEMLDGLSEDMQSKSPDMIYEKVASVSCKAAVKGNHTMSVQEADALIDQLLDMENPYACPHGRPTMIAMSQYELEKKFKRIV